jgi:hypothetical protein
MNGEHLTALYSQMMDEWFGSLRLGDKVYNYSDDRPDRGTVRKLREGIIKEIHDNGRYDRYVIVDNLTTGRQNKWGDYALVKPPELEAISEKLTQLNTVSEADLQLWQKSERTEKTIDEKAAQAGYERLLENAKELLKNDDVQQGKCSGVYGAFNKNTSECIYIGKSRSSIATRWREHARFWKKLRPINRQPLLTQYLHFFSDQIEWKVLLPVASDVDNDLLEYSERRLFEKYQPIANSIVPNGTFYGRSVMEGEGDSISVSEWNPRMVEIRIRKGQFNGFSDGKSHFDNELD